MSDRLLSDQHEPFIEATIFAMSFTAFVAIPLVFPAEVCHDMILFTFTTPQSTPVPVTLTSRDPLVHSGCPDKSVKLQPVELRVCVCVDAAL